MSFCPPGENAQGGLVHRKSMVGTGKEELKIFSNPELAFFQYKYIKKKKLLVKPAVYT